MPGSTWSRSLQRWEQAGETMYPALACLNISNNVVNFIPSMLGLKLETDPHWADLAEHNIAEVLTDHAWCEQKAASNAISLLVNFPQYNDLVIEMSKIAVEELTHFAMVHQ